MNQTPYPIIRFACASAVSLMLCSCGLMEDRGSTRHASEWGQVVLGGGGCVPGIILHPQVADLAYIRTDVGGAYRWDQPGSRWIPLLDHLTTDRWNLHGVESLAIDPGDAQGGLLAAALGGYNEPWAMPQNGVLAISTDRGATWRETGPKLAIASNRQQEQGERLAFDRIRPGRLWYASMKDGLWRGDDDAWERVPLPGDGPGLPAALNCLVIHSPREGAETIWVGSAKLGFYTSTDGGATWLALPGPATDPHRACADRDGQLLVAHAGGAHRCDGSEWIPITPAGAKCVQTVAADPFDPSHLFAAEKKTYDARLFESHDRGATWQVFTAQRKPSRSWWSPRAWVTKPHALACDPLQRGRLWLTDWYGAYRCEDTAAADPQLANPTDGLENTVVLALSAPCYGPNQLMSGIADVSGFDHVHLDQAPPTSIRNTGGPADITCTGIDNCPSRPLAVRVGAAGSHRNGMSVGSWSADGGATWRPFPAVPGGKPEPDRPTTGRIAISADGEALVWALHGNRGVFASHDHGASWQESAPRLAIGKGSPWSWAQPLCADRSAPRTFYLVSEERLWRSDDGGNSWLAGAAVIGEGDGQGIAAHPARAGVLWLALGRKGLARSDDGGRSLVPLPAMPLAEVVAIGPGRDAEHPLVHVIGAAGRHAGLFVSRDLGATFEPVVFSGQVFGCHPTTIAPDQRLPGRCFVGTKGRGILWYLVSP